jgi:hypothetical protein
LASSAAGSNHERDRGTGDVILIELQATGPSRK